MTKTHCMNKTRIYNIWNLMRKRCRNKADPYYGGRGIEVCLEWNDFEVFYRWARANGYTAFDETLTLERLNVNGNYEPGNCTWIPRSDQAKNTRRSKRYEAFGESKFLREWSQDSRCEVSYGTLFNRVKSGIAPATAMKR